MGGLASSAWRVFLFASACLALILPAQASAQAACIGQGESCGGSSSCCLPFACDAGACRAAPLRVCAADSFENSLIAAGVAGLGMALIVALAYMFGEIFQNAKVSTWSKYEMMQVFASLAVAFVLIGLLGTFCAVKVGEAGSMFGTLPYVFLGKNLDKNLYEGAMIYLENLQGAGLRNMAQLRFNLAAYEIRTTYNRFQCDSICWLSMASTNVATFGGETMELAIANNLLGTATVAYLSAVFQYFTLQYVLNGLFLAFLPMAIVVRSVPFMRNFGGALVGIIVALYVLYPLMLVADAIVVPSLAQGTGNGAVIYDRDGTGCAGTDAFRASDGTEYLRCESTHNPDGVDFEWQMGGKGIGTADLPRPYPNLALSIKANVLIFMASVFLPAINFVVIAAFARDLSRFLGEEAEISKLGRMV